MVNLKIWQITFVNIRISFSSKNYRKWAKTSLLQGWDANNWNFKIFLHLFPFVIGFSQLIWARYKFYSFSSFFEKNVPGFVILKQDVFLETFEKLNSKLFSEKEIQNIDIFYDSIFINISKNNEEFYSGIFQNEEKILGSNWYVLPFQKVNSFLPLPEKDSLPFLNNILNGKFYYHLDEIPLKMQNNNRINSQKNIDFLLNKTEKIYNKRENIFVSTKKNKFSTKKFFIINKKLFGSSYEINKKTINSENKIKNYFSDKKRNLFQKEITTFFYNKGIYPIQNFEKLIVNLENKNTLLFNQFQFFEYSIDDILYLLNQNNKFEKNITLFPRLFSGYNYPDMGTNKILSLGLNIYSKEKNFSLPVKIKIPSNIPKFFEMEKTVPSILINKRSLKDRKDGFFGLDLENTSQSIKKYWQNDLLKENLQNQSIQSKEFDDSDFDGWFLLFEKKAENESLYIIEENQIFKNLFITDNQKPVKNKNSNFLVTINDVQKEKIDYHISSSLQKFLPNSIIYKNSFAENYKRIPSFSNSLFEKSGKLKSYKEDDPYFFECWEPISLNSWMIISQFSIGLFILKILKDLYQDYGKELLYYVLQFAASLGIDIKEIKEQFISDDTDKGYRLIKKVKKGFKDIAGIDGILPQLSEIVWFLRNSGRSAKYKNSIPKGILLVGPPGTGKTLLVQAIAGEAEVPVLVESGSLLTDPQQNGRGIQRLKNLFDEARQLSPCIVFIDEVDTLGEKRQQIIQPVMGNDEIIESIYSIKKEASTDNFIPKPLNIEEESEKKEDLEYDLFRSNQDNQSTIGVGNFQQKLESKKTRLSLLMQFLVEMDGLNELSGVIVIGATNRPNVLDPALIRPGRFDQTLSLELPGKQKRIEILKLYSEKLKIEKNISWNYLANRTIGFSAADLAAAMNESAIQAILKNTLHTVETIEKGIDLVTSYTIEDSSSNLFKKSKDPFFITRFAFYQAGKAIISSLLPDHQPSVVLHLWPRPKNARHRNLQLNQLFELQNKSQLENLIISFYSGKAGELLFLYGNEKHYSWKYWQSNFGIEDLNAASSIAYLMIDNWYLYSRKLINRKNQNLVTDKNNKEFREIENLDFIKLIDTEMEDEIEIDKIAKLSRSDRSQQKAFGPWWQVQVAKQVSEIEYFYSDWYRIYLPDPEESILNIEWIPPDEYFHTNKSLKNLSNQSDINFNDIYKVEKDYIYHNLILNSFNRCFSLLEENREFLDYFADYLIRNKILRQDQIYFIMSQKIKDLVGPKNKTIKKSENDKTIKIVDASWGEKSRRNYSRFINLQLIKPLIKNNNKYSSPFYNLSKQ